MRSNAHLLHLLEDLHMPLDDPASPTDWKEWYHFVLLDPVHGRRVLANVSLSGRPRKGQITVTVLATLPRVPSDPGQHDTFGFVQDHDWQPGMVHRAPVRITAADFRCEIVGPRTSFEARDDAARVELRLEGRADAAPLLIPEYAPFGSGFVGWGLVPGVQVQGRLDVGSWSQDIRPEWFCYHDHNYGRFRWGDDVGWIWLVAAGRAAATDVVFVLHRGNNRDAKLRGAPYLFVYEQGRIRKVFMGGAVDLRWQWSSEPVLPVRLPGAMASIFADRTILVPRALEIRAADERDRLTLQLPVDASIQLVLPDNEQRQYTFIEELSGTTTAHYEIDGNRQELTGLFYAEYVH